MKKIIITAFAFFSFFVIAAPANAGSVFGSAWPDAIVCVDNFPGNTYVFYAEGITVSTGRYNYWEPAGNYGMRYSAAGAFVSEDVSSNCNGIAIASLGTKAINFGGGSGTTTNSTTTIQYITAGTSTPLYIASTSSFPISTPTTDLFYGYVLFLVGLVLVFFLLRTKTH